MYPGRPSLAALLAVSLAALVVAATAAGGAVAAPTAATTDDWRGGGGPAAVNDDGDGDGGTLTAASTADPTFHAVNTRIFGDTEPEAFADVVATRDGGYLAVGETEVAGTDGVVAGWAVKVDAGGVEEWRYVSPGVVREQSFLPRPSFRAATQTANGEYVLVGQWPRIANDGREDPDTWLLRLDADGAVVWDRKVATPGPLTDAGVLYQDGAAGVVERPDGTLLLAGERVVPGYNGAALWTRVFRANGTPASPTADVVVETADTRLRATDLVAAADGDYLVVGQEDRLEGREPSVVAETDGAGTVRWNRTLALSQHTFLTAATEAGGGYLVVGYTNILDRPDYRGDRPVVVRFGPGGAVTGVVGGADVARLTDVLATPSGVVAVGTSRGVPDGTDADRADRVLLRTLRDDGRTAATDVFDVRGHAAAAGAAHDDGRLAVAGEVTTVVNDRVYRDGLLRVFVRADGGEDGNNSTASVPDRPVPGTGAAAPPTDPDDDGLYEDVDGSGVADFDDAVALAFVDGSVLTEAEVAALDFDGDAAVTFDDAVELAFLV